MSNISIDLGILSLFNASPTTLSPLASAQASFLALFNELLKLKHQKDQAFNAQPDEAQIHDFQASKYELFLPDKTTVFPRHKKIPNIRKIKTRWEAFAAKKGIQKKRRSRMVYDEEKSDWVPRWGARSIKKNKEKGEWAIALKPQDRDDADPFAKKGLDKELRNEREKLKKIKNEERKQGKYEGKKKALKKNLEVSTASLGKFDKKAHKKEPKIKTKIHQNKPVFKSVREEKQRDLEILNLINKTA